MMAYVVSEGRLFALKPSEWSMLLAGVAICGVATLLFDHQLCAGLLAVAVPLAGNSMRW